MSGLTDRLEEEPDYRPHCLNCSTMRRVTLLAAEPEKGLGRRMVCEIVRDDTMDRGYASLGMMPPIRVGCGICWDIDTNEPAQCSGDQLLGRT